MYNLLEKSEYEILSEYETFNEEYDDYIVERVTEMESTKKIMSSFTGSIVKVVDAHLLVTLRIVKCGKAHTIGQNQL